MIQIRFLLIALLGSGCTIGCCFAARAGPSNAPPPAFKTFAAGLTFKAGNLAGDGAAPPVARTGVFYPSAYGADPTGVNDSTSALQRTIDAAFAHVLLPGGGGVPFIGGLSNTGGAVVDLQGGGLRVSKPLALGSGGGMRLCCGTLIAAPSFPTDAFLLVGAGHLEDITIEDVAFECGGRGGAVQLTNPLRVTIARVFMIHFATIGIHVLKGHEVHVTDSFLGEFEWGESGSGTGGKTTNTTGTAIQIDGQDHWISDIVIFYSHRGVVLNGGALVLSNTHIYNNGDEALYVAGHAVRVLGCYFDFSRVVVVDPVAVDISHSLFLGGTGVEIRSSGTGALVSGLTVVNNQFVLGDAPSSIGDIWEAVYLNTTAGMFRSVNSTDISGNANPPATYGSHVGASQRLRQTVIRQTLRRGFLPSASWEFDLTDALVFPVHVAPLHVTFSVEAEEGFPRAVLRPIKAELNGSVKVLIESEQPFSGAVHIVARQAGIFG